MKIRKLCFMAAICLLFAGCWDRVELENRGFIVSLGIDKYTGGDTQNQAMEGAKEKSRYSVCAVMPHVMDMKEAASSDKSKEVKSADSATVWGCIDLMDAVSSQKLYLGQTKLLVLGNDLMSDAALFRQALDAMARNRDISQKLYLLSTKERADGVLRAPIPGEPMLGIFMVNHYKNNGGSGYINSYKVLAKTLTDLHSTGCTLIPEIEKREPPEKDEEYSGAKPDTSKKGEDGDSESEEDGGATESIPITLGGGAVIKDYKLAGWLDGAETRGFEWVMKNCRDCEVSVGYGNGYIPLDVYNSRPKVKFATRNGGLACLIRVKLTGAVHENDFNGRDTLAMDEKALESAYGKAISGEIAKTASKLQSFGADVYNFKDLLRKTNNRLYRRYSGDWERCFREMEIIPEVKVDIISIGIIK